jgi:Ca2+-binding RTX toxin-like protein
MTNLIVGTNGDDTAWYDWVFKQWVGNLVGTNGNDRIEGLDGHDDLVGNGGNDTLIGGKGDDWMGGGTGNDSLDGGAGNDTLFGFDDNDSLAGGSDDDELFGGLGHDTLVGGTGADWMDGGDGNDVYFIDSVDDVISGDASGIDRIFTAGIHINLTVGGWAEIEHVTITGTTGVEVVANDKHNELIGGDGNDELFGGAGHDTLVGGVGKDSLIGNEGDDTYIIDEYDQIFDTTGIDTIIYRGAETNLSTSFYENVEAGHIENFIYEGPGAKITWLSANNMDNTIDVRLAKGATVKADGGVDTIFGSGGHDSLDGGWDNDYLFGYNGHDKLDGGTGDDYLAGGIGNDTYYVGGNDTVIEAAGEGTDTVWIYGQGGSKYTTPDNVENLLVRDSAFTGFQTLRGNSLGNLMGFGTGAGDSGTLALYGYGGNDVLYGGDFADTLNGGIGDDTMYGGRGDDTYYVDSKLDKVVEIEGTLGGVDWVKTTLSIFALGEDLENLEYTSSNDAYLYGNGLKNTIIGDWGDDEIWGYEGSDRLFGSNGDDHIMAGDGADTVKGGEGADTMQGGSGIDTLSYAGDLNTGGVTVNLATGTGSGNDAEGDTFGGFENLVGGKDNDKLFGSAVANLIEGGEGLDVLWGEAGNDTLMGNNGIDELKGGGGNDQLYGGFGDDAFLFVKSETVAGDKDRIRDFEASGLGDSAGDELLFIGFAETDVKLKQAGDDVQIRLDVGDGNVAFVFVEDRLMADVGDALLFF